jgi:hypothetical protein
LVVCGRSKMISWEDYPWEYWLMNENWEVETAYYCTSHSSSRIRTMMLLTFK